MEKAIHVIWGGNTAGIDLARDSISVFGDEPIPQVPQWSWNDPQDPSQHLPDTAEDEQKLADGGGPHGEIAMSIKKIDRGQRDLAGLLGHGFPGLPVDRGELQELLPVPGDREPDDLLAHPAFAVVEEYWSLVSHTKSIGFEPTYFRRRLIEPAPSSAMNVDGAGIGASPESNTQPSTEPSERNLSLKPTRDDSHSSAMLSLVQ